MFSPYIINSNIITQISETSDYPTMLNAVGTNLGNSYITYGLIKSLYGKLVNLNSINFFWKTNPKKLESELEKINNSSHVFFIFQDFIRPKNLQFKLDYKATSDFIKRINKPIIIPNIGMNDFEYNTNIYTRFSTELIDFLRVLSEHSNFIGVRGKYTQEVLAKLGIKNTMITGCPSYYEMGRNRIIKKYTNIDKSDIIYTYPFSLEKENVPSIIQGDKELGIMNAISYDKYAILNDCNNLKVINSYINKQYNMFTNIEDWKQYLHNYKVIAGERIHGAIIAINCGLNPIIFLRDARAKEMMDYFQIPYFEHSDRDKNLIELFDKIDYSKANNIYNKLYDNWEDFMHKNNCLMFYENPEIKNAEAFNQPKTIELYSDIITKKDIIIGLINKNNEKIDKIQQEIIIQNQKIALLQKHTNLKEILSKLFSVTNAPDKKHKVWCVLGIKMKFKKRAQSHAGVERESNFAI